MLKKGIVYRLWCEDDKTSECVVIPKVLRDPLLMLAHDYSGHNGFRRTYNAMKRTILLARHEEGHPPTL